MEDLKPCPFCGGTELDCKESIYSELYVLLEDGFFYEVICESCGARKEGRIKKTQDGAKKDAMEAWNTRWIPEISMNEAVGATIEYACGDGYDQQARAEQIVEAIANLCGARIQTVD